jgi:AI-2 transport protein TqsA
MRIDNNQGPEALKIAACVVIVAYGIRAASHLLSLLLLSLLLTYAILPLARWLVQRFHFRKGAAIICTVLLIVAFDCAVTFALVKAGAQMTAKLPVYELRIQHLHQQFDGFLARHGIGLADESVRGFLSTGRIFQFVNDTLPTAVGLISDHLLIVFLTLLFLAEQLDSKRGNSFIAKALDNFGKDVQHFIASSAETGALIAIVNLLLLTVLGVDFAVIWCVLYFFLHFIPNFGFLIALVPPTLLALLMLGWKRSLVVLACLVLTELLGENVLQPLLMKKDLNVSLLVITLSLVGWGYLLGPAGVILSLPLTLALRRFLDRTGMSVSSQGSPVAT